MEIKELIERWETTGLLEGLNEKAQIAQLLEDCARYLIDSEKEGKISPDICGAMLPCVRKIYGIDNSIAFDFKFLHEILDHCLSKICFSDSVFAMDAEAEATSLACDYFVSAQKENKAKKDLIKILAKPARTLQIKK